MVLTPTNLKLLIRSDMSILRYIKIFNAVVNSVGSIGIWYYFIKALEIGIEYLTKIK